MTISFIGTGFSLDGQHERRHEEIAAGAENGSRNRLALAKHLRSGISVISRVSS
jgi:hypothetical protein